VLKDGSKYLHHPQVIKKLVECCQNVIRQHEDIIIRPIKVDIVEPCEELLEGCAICYGQVFIELTRSAGFWDLRIWGTIIPVIDAVCVIAIYATHVALVFWEHESERVQE